MNSVEGASVIVTGGGSGIGAATARHLAALGARTTICGRREERIRDVADHIGASCRPVRADITRDGDRQALVAAAIEHGGGIDVLVHAAANMYSSPLEQLDAQALHDIFDSNVVGPMLLSGLCAPHLERRAGAIIFFGSVHTRRAFPGASPYAATKGAVETLTSVLAAELGPRQVRVSCVRPGGVFTELNQRAGLFTDDEALERLRGLGPAHALGRTGTVEEIAEAVEYLVRAPWTTGAVLVVDGGLGLGVTHT